MNGIVAVAAMLRAALGVHEIRARRPVSLFLPPSLSLSFSRYLSPLGLSLLLPPHAVALGSLFSLVPQCALYPLPHLVESKLRSAGWPAVLP